MEIIEAETIQLNESVIEMWEESHRTNQKSSVSILLPHDMEEIPRSGEVPLVRQKIQELKFKRRVVYKPPKNS